jgi:hypothetical protein
MAHYIGLVPASVNKFIDFFSEIHRNRRNQAGPNSKTGEFWNSNSKFLKNNKKSKNT